MQTLPGTVSFLNQFGRSVMLLEKGTELPAEKRLVHRLGGWKHSARVDFVYGDNSEPTTNTPCGSLALVDLPWLDFQKPKCGVEASIDENARLTLSLTNLKTGKGVRLRDIDLSSIPLPDPVYDFNGAMLNDYFGQPSPNREKNLVGPEPLTRAVTALKDWQLRQKFFAGHYGVLDEYGLTPPQLRAVQEMATSSMYNTYSLYEVLIAVHHAAQIHEQNPDWVLCKQCAGLGLIRQQRQTFLGPMINQYGCSRCGGKGFRPA